MWTARASQPSSKKAGRQEDWENGKKAEAGRLFEEPERQKERETTEMEASSERRQGRGYGKKTDKTGARESLRGLG